MLGGKLEKRKLKLAGKDPGGKTDKLEGLWRVCGVLESRFEWTERHAQRGIEELLSSRPTRVA